MRKLPLKYFLAAVMQGIDAHRVLARVLSDTDYAAKCQSRLRKTLIDRHFIGIGHVLHDPNPCLIPPHQWNFLKIDFGEDIASGHGVAYGGLRFVRFGAMNEKEREMLRQSCGDDALIPPKPLLPPSTMIEIDMTPRTIERMRDSSSTTPAAAAPVAETVRISKPKQDDQPLVSFRRDPGPNFKQVTDFNWEKVIITFLSDDDIRITYANTPLRLEVNYAQMGFKNNLKTQYDEPVLSWVLFRSAFTGKVWDLSNKNKRIDPKFRDNLKHRVSDIRKKLKAFFKTTSDPFTTYKSGATWTPKFVIRDERAIR